MYAYSFKHIDSSADSIEVINWFQTCLKQLSTLAGLKKIKKDAEKMRTKLTKNGNLHWGEQICQLEKNSL